MMMSLSAPSVSSKSKSPELALKSSSSYAANERLSPLLNFFFGCQMSHSMSRRGAGSRRSARIMSPHSTERGCRVGTPWSVHTVQIVLLGRYWEQQIGGRGSKSCIRTETPWKAPTQCRDWERQIGYFHVGEADRGSGSCGSTFHGETWERQIKYFHGGEADRGEWIARMSLLEEEITTGRGGSTCERGGGTSEIYAAGRQSGKMGRRDVRERGHGAHHDNTSGEEDASRGMELGARAGGRARGRDTQRRDWCAGGLGGGVAGACGMRGGRRARGVWDAGRKEGVRSGGHHGAGGEGAQHRGRGRGEVCERPPSTLKD
jgi:hypothetical protein